jgi:D-sedoheptulose 7-phosphate isomerase
MVEMDVIDSYLNELETVVRNISRDEVRAVVEILFEAWQSRRTIFIIGNGGSAATASHMMNDLNKFTAVGDVPRVRSIALTDNVPLMTAIGNDLAYGDIFVEPLKNLLEPTDILIAISTSGNSPNVIKAVEYARSRGVKVVGFCGAPGGKLAQMADVKVVIPSKRIGHQEDGHMVLDHVISAALRERIEQSSVAMVQAGSRGSGETTNSETNG